MSIKRKHLKVKVYTVKVYWLFSKRLFSVGVFFHNKQEDRDKEETFIIPQFHFYWLTNIKKFICNFTFEIATKYL